MPGDAEDTQIPVNPGGQQEAGLDPDNADQEASGMNAVDRIRDALKDNVSPAVTGELIRLFLDYQGESHGYKGPNHRYELRLLPEFGPGKTLDWDGLTAFIYYMANYFEHDEEGYYFLMQSCSTKRPDGCFRGWNTSIGAACILIIKMGYIKPPVGICTEAPIIGSKAFQGMTGELSPPPLTGSTFTNSTILVSHTAVSEKT